MKTSKNTELKDPEYWNMIKIFRINGECMTIICAKCWRFDQIIKYFKFGSRTSTEKHLDRWKRYTKKFDWVYKHINNEQIYIIYDNDTSQCKNVNGYNPLIKKKRDVSYLIYDTLKGTSA